MGRWLLFSPGLLANPEGGGGPWCSLVSALFEVGE
jgi:hypothetical protein